MSFRFPYQARIMAQLTVAGVVHEPVELFRARRVIHQPDLNYWTAELRASQGWNWWVEHFTRDNYVLGGHRHIPCTHGKGRDRLILNANENRELEESGVAPSFKFNP